MRIFFYLLLTLFSTNLISQNKPVTYQTNKDADPKAKAILKQVKDKLAIDQGVSINFEFKYTAAETKPAINKGAVDIKSKKFKLTLGDEEITSDNTSIWTYLKKRNEVQIQDASIINDDPLSPFKLLQIHDSPDFTYILNGETAGLATIEFKPLDKNAEFFKVKVDVDKAKKQYKRLVLYMKNGDLYELNILSQLKKNFKDDAFVFSASKYPGVKTEDLR